MNVVELNTARRTTPAPAPLRRRSTDAPAPFAPSALDEDRRAMAIALVVEAAEAEDAGANPELVEALRDKARSVLGVAAPRNMAPEPLAMRRSSDHVTRAVAV